MSLQSWLSERIPISQETLLQLTNEPVPNHMKKWFFALGGTPAYCFFVQIFTGILLAFYYEPSPQTAYQSVEYITNEATFGWFLRSIHKWAATIMLATLILHQMRVYFTGAYRRPRELNWMIGMLLLLTTLVTGFTGYSLVYEQLSYWGATVGANIADSVPVVGTFAKRLLLGGDAFNERTVSRFFVLHAAVLPMTIMVLVGIHIAMVRVHGVTELKFKKDEGQPAKHFDFYPDHVYMELVVGLLLMVLLTTLAIALPAELGPRADPLTTPEIIKPEWFFYPVFRWLKIFSGTAAVLSTGGIVGLMIGWPLIDAWVRKNTRFKEASVWIGILGVLAIVTLTCWEAAVAH